MIRMRQIVKNGHVMLVISVAIMNGIDQMAVMKSIARTHRRHSIHIISLVVIQKSFTVVKSMKVH
jgi:PleD family two-component response regulator